MLGDVGADRVVDHAPELVGGAGADLGGGERVGQPVERGVEDIARRVEQDDDRAHPGEDQQGLDPITHAVPSGLRGLAQFLPPAVQEAALLPGGVPRGAQLGEVGAGVLVRAGGRRRGRLVEQVEEVRYVLAVDGLVVGLHGGALP